MTADMNEITNQVKVYEWSKVWLDCTNEISLRGGVFGKVKEQTWCVAAEKFVRLRSFSLWIYLQVLLWVSNDTISFGSSRALLFCLLY
jgi:hypothetical protein